MRAAFVLGTVATPAVVAIVLSVWAGCGSNGGSDGGAATAPDSGVSVGPEAGVTGGQDSGALPEDDSGASSDAGTTDEDAGAGADANSAPRDATASDGRSPDGGSPDSGASDGGSYDGGQIGACGWMDDAGEHSGPCDPGQCCHGGAIGTFYCYTGAGSCPAVP